MPVCENPECGRRFVSEGEPGCPYCRAQNEQRTCAKVHLCKRGGVWLVWVRGYYLAQLTTKPKQRRGRECCRQLADLWNASNA